MSSPVYTSMRVHHIGVQLTRFLGRFLPRYLSPIKIEHVTIQHPRVPTAFDGYTLLQLSDFHIGPYLGAKQVQHIVTLALQQNCDAIVVTGDFVSDVIHGELHTVTHELKRLTAPDGVYAILGNHDWYEGAEGVADAVRQAGLRLLRNEHLTLQRNGALLYCVGLDDARVHQADYQKATANIPADAAIMVWAHEPDIAPDIAKDARVIVQLSGHTHGGQINLPFKGPLSLPILGKIFVRGLHRVGEMWLYVNRGLGVTTLPMRLNASPEMTLITLRRT